ncbi:folylpolyglutamate synthase, mitochondrial-like isoform X1 [Diabrotica undecimpunctata]|uniref:folylpolyglutamate synthase, mitochondrial-like isoform X1 n=1 Tax=Diabrotica undecimpunctata TaxID=50387 RepID=UPI003B64257E
MYKTMKFPCIKIINSIKKALSRHYHYTVNQLERSITNMRSYQEALQALNELQTNADYIKNVANQPRNASNIPEVIKFLGRTGLSVTDLDRLSVIHVTGTNGKGSTCAYTEKILRSHGCTTGFFSSPHLLDVRERIRINGKPISKTIFKNYFWKLYNLLNKQKDSPEDMPLYFRFMTILAFHIFLDHKVDVAILEVGIGGEYDCTNVVRKTSVVGITPLDFDHMALLGNTLESIAWNKAGIMKAGCSAFTVKQPSNALKVFEERSVEKNCSLTVVEGDYYSGTNSNIPLHVRQTNASLALALSEAFINKDTNNNFKKFDLDLAKRSIEETYWPGRYEIRNFQKNTFYLDGAHTLDSCCVCRDWFIAHVKNSKRKRCLIFNVTRARASEVFFKELLKCNFDVVIFIPNVGSSNDKPDTADFVCPAEKQLLQCETNKEQWLNMEETSNKKVEKAAVFPSFAQAVEFLNASGTYDCLVTGSIHLIGAAMSVLDPTLSGALEDD